MAGRDLTFLIDRRRSTIFLLILLDRLVGPFELGWGPAIDSWVVIFFEQVMLKLGGRK